MATTTSRTATLIYFFSYLFLGLRYMQDMYLASKVQSVKFKVETIKEKIEFLREQTETKYKSQNFNVPFEQTQLYRDFCNLIVMFTEADNRLSFMVNDLTPIEYKQKA